MTDADTADTGMDQNGDTGTVDAGGDAARTFSQADVDRIVKDRLARQKGQFADYDDLKLKASKLDEIEAQNQTELEKAQKRAAELEQKATEAAARAQEALLRSAVVSEAARKNVVDPDAALALLDRSKIEFDDSGTPTNLAAEMDALLQAKPYLVGGGRGDADQGARGGDAGVRITREQLAEMSAQGRTAEIVQLQSEGKLDHLMGAA